MHRTDADNHVGNRFSGGDPARGRLATQIHEEWLNDVQETLAVACEVAGPLVKGDPNQLLAAIRKLGFASAAAVQDGGVFSIAGNQDRSTYEGSATELANGIGEGRSGIRATSAAGGAQLELYGYMGGVYAQQWRANRSGSTGVSDDRLKRILEDIPPQTALEVVQHLRVTRFRWTFGNAPETESVGFLASNVAHALARAGVQPEPFVEANEGGFLMINRDAILALVVASIQALLEEQQHKGKKK